MMSAEILTETTENYITGKTVVRIHYRPEGSLTWNKVVAVPVEGQTTEDLIANAPALVRQLCGAGMHA